MYLLKGNRLIKHGVVITDNKINRMHRLKPNITIMMILSVKIQEPKSKRSSNQIMLTWPTSTEKLVKNSQIWIFHQSSLQSGMVTQCYKPLGKEYLK